MKFSYSSTCSGRGKRFNQVNDIGTRAYIIVKLLHLGTLVILVCKLTTGSCTMSAE